MAASRSQQAISPPKETVGRRSGSWTRFVLPAFTLAWILIVIVPVAALMVWPFLGYQDYQFVLKPNLDAVKSIFGSGRYQVTLATLRIAGTITVLNLLVAVPFAIWVARQLKSPLSKSLVLAALTIPFFLSLSSRTIVWRAVLGNTGLINTTLMQMGLISEPIEWLLFSEFAVHLGLFGPSFPTMFLPIYLAVTLIDDELFEAAADLGASPARIFLDVVLPLIAPGILAGIIFTFVPMLGETVVPTLLGGGQVSMLGGSINSLLGVLNYPVASALGLLILVILVILLVLLRLAGSRHAKLGAVFAALSR